MFNLLSRCKASGFILRVGAYGLLIAISWVPLSAGDVSAGNLDVTVRQGTTTGPIVAGASVCVFPNNTTSQIGPTQMTDPNGFIRFVLGPTSQTVTVRAFASGNIRTENNVVVLANQTTVRTVALQGNGTFPNPCAPAAPAVQPPPQGSPGPLQPLNSQQMHQAIQRANFFGTQMFPIFSSARCLHCHGGVIPGNASTRINHPDIGTLSCTTCHNTTAGLTQAQQNDWHVVSAARFVTLGPVNGTRNATITAKPWQEICKMVRASFPNDGALLSHFQADILIGWAFAPNGPQRLPQGSAPGTQAGLSTLAQQWISFRKPCGLEVQSRPGSR